MPESPETEKTQYVGGERVSVLLHLPLAPAYDYRVPAGLRLAPGDVVAVPLGRRRAVGVVRGPGTGEVGDEKLKDVTGLHGCPPLPPETLKFIDWAAWYTMSPPGSVLKMAVSVPGALDPPEPVTVYALRENFSTLPKGVRETPARARVIEHTRTGEPKTRADLARAAKCSPGVVAGLAKAGVLREINIDPEAQTNAPTPDADAPGPKLSPEQAAAARALCDACKTDKFSVTLLEGVPGSGKTEVYFEAAAETLRAGKQVLVLLPEIALSPQWLERFEARFRAKPALWHSELGEAARKRTWRAAATGRARVVVGARSALFLPFPKLGLIIVDEEHEPAYKQEDGVIYHARDMAVVRARAGNAPAVLVSATPSMETRANVERGRYTHLALPERHGGAPPPQVTAVDVRRHPPARGQWLAEPLINAVRETLAAGEQAMLFLNRRGYAPLTLCRSCGHRMECPECAAWMVEHRSAARLMCHHCGRAVSAPKVCPACEAEDSLVPCGPGVERLAEEAAKHFPDARTAVAASDTLGGPRAARELFRRIEDREVDLIIGTQVMAKGHHFPGLTLVGVVDADLGLAGGDLRAAERTFQLLYQAAGRAGRTERADKPGRVFMQTYMPEHPVIEALAAADIKRFAETELEARRGRAMPPFGRLVAVIVSDTDAPRAERAAETLGRTAPQTNGVRTLGPAPAPLAKLRGRHRRRLLLIAGESVKVQPVIAAWLARARKTGNIARQTRVQTDIDPQSFM
ncbi:MAG: primosomal protein N' [Rhodospirillales bacterium]